MKCEFCEHYHENKYCDVLDLCPCYPDKGCDFAESRKELINKQDVLDILEKGEKTLNRLIRVFQSLNSDEERMFKFGHKLVRACVNDVKALPSVQAESDNDTEFWCKRAKEYEKMVGELIADMIRGVKFDSVELNENGLVFKKQS